MCDVFGTWAHPLSLFRTKIKSVGPGDRRDIPSQLPPLSAQAVQSLPGITVSSIISVACKVQRLMKTCEHESGILPPPPAPVVSWKPPAFPASAPKTPTKQARPWLHTVSNHRRMVFSLNGSRIADFQMESNEFLPLPHTKHKTPEGSKAQK